MRARTASAVVFGAAFAARLAMVYVRGGSLHDSTSYDPSVYYAAADALVHGRVPYRDFTLLHPPGLMLALTPFALLGRMTTDHIGFMAANLAWMALGAVNAVLVTLIGRRLQLGSAAAMIGGLAYALWFESTRSEFATRLEPLGNFFVLLGLLAFAVSARSSTRFASIAGGLALGAAASVKIWYLVPLVIVLAWHLVARRPRRQLGWAALAAVAGVVAVNGPFFLLAGSRMWLMVVSDQLGRKRMGVTSVQRLTQFATGGQLDPSTAPRAAIVVTALAALLFLGICGLAWQRPAGRLVTTLALAQLAVLVAAPSFFPFYSDYLAPSLALTVASAAAVLLAASPRPALRRRLLVASAWVPVALAGGSTAAIDLFHPMPAMRPAPDHTLQQAAASARCVQSDSPMALIQLDALSRDLANGCQLWVDVTGRTYAAPLQPTGRLHGQPRGRATYPAWQHALLRYLLSGNDVVVVQPRETGISRHTLHELDQGRTVGTADGYVVRRS